jgi:hypothetical protein
MRTDQNPDDLNPTEQSVAEKIPIVRSDMRYAPRRTEPRVFGYINRLLANREISDEFRLHVWQMVGAIRGLTVETTEKIDKEIARLNARINRKRIRIDKEITGLNARINRKGTRPAARPRQRNSGPSRKTTPEPTSEMWDVWGADTSAFSKLHEGLRRAELIEVDLEHFRSSFRGECRTPWEGTIAQLNYLFVLLERNRFLSAHYIFRNKWETVARIFSNVKATTLAEIFSRNFGPKDEPNNVPTRKKCSLINEIILQVRAMAQSEGFGMPEV